MRPLLWKELRENAGWAAILFTGVAVALGFWALEELPDGRIDESIASDDVLGILILAAPLGALALGLLQILPELQRDAWAFLIHRPVSPARIFLAKTIAGTGLYLAAVLVPFCAAAIWTAAGAPERRVFHPYMLWPGVAIVLASAGFHGAAMLVALRRARWVGTRLLPLVLPASSVAVTFTWIIDWSEMPSPALLLLILAAHAVTTAAAWGSFVRGGEMRGQPAAARAALGVSLGFAALGILGGVLALCVSVLSELRPPRSVFDRRGAGDETMLWQTELLHHFPVGLRGRDRIAIGLFGPLGPADQWIHSRPDGTLLGYREERSHGRARSRRLVRIVGPDGFREPPATPARRFGRLLPWARWLDHGSLSRAGNRSERCHRAVLACVEGIYDIDSAREEVRLVVAAPEGEVLRGVSVEQRADGAEVAVATDRSVRFYATREEIVGTATDEATGQREDITVSFPDREIARAALPAPIRDFPSFGAGRAAGGETYIFMGKRGISSLSFVRLIEADASGNVLRRRDVLHEGEDAGLARGSICAAAAFTPLALAGAAALADETLLAGGGPGFLRASAAERPGWVLGLAGIWTLQALACAAAAWAAARRHGFSASGRRLWVVLGALLGPPGLVAMAGTRDWPPTPACAACGRRRAVSLERCPYCGADLEPPPRDGTEVIEDTRRRDLIGSEVGSIP